METPNGWARLSGAGPRWEGVRRGLRGEPGFVELPGGGRKPIEGDALPWRPKGCWRLEEVGGGGGGAAPRLPRDGRWAARDFMSSGEARQSVASPRLPPPPDHVRNESSARGGKGRHSWRWVKTARNIGGSIRQMEGWISIVGCTGCRVLLGWWLLRTQAHQTRAGPQRNDVPQLDHHIHDADALCEVRVSLQTGTHRRRRRQACGHKLLLFTRRRGKG